MRWERSFDARDLLGGKSLEFMIRTQKEAYNLEALVKGIGDDILVAIWGGRSHIGAVGIAQPRPSLRDKGKISATASVFCFLGHKEDLVVREAAERISSALNANVVVTAGIHWGDIDTAGITCVMENSRELVGMIIERIGKEVSR
jgi:gallate decarboxylase subunit D